MNASPQQILIAGAGGIGGALAAELAARGDEVVTLRRSEQPAMRGVHAMRADLTRSEGLGVLPAQMQTVVFCVAPDERNEKAYRALYVDGLRRLLDRMQIGRLLFVSSTAVYAEDAGEWVDERTPENAETFNGRVLIEAEREARLHAGSVILRFSGLYGPGREAMLRRVRDGEANRNHWTNRLHMDDAVASLRHLLDTPSVRGIYLGSDDEPALEATISTWLREREQLSALPAPAPQVTGRRIRNLHLRGTGWSPKYPDFRSGYAAVLDAADAGANP